MILAPQANFKQNGTKILFWAFLKTFDQKIAFFFARGPLQFYHILLQVFVCRIHGKVQSGFRLHFETCLKTCFWIPMTCRHQIVSLISAQFGLVAKYGLVL